MTRRLLLTGAAGGVAAMLSPGLAALAEHDGWDLVRTDRSEGRGTTPVDVVGDLADPAFLARVTDGVDAVVHLAANANPNATWDELRVPNVDVVAALLATGVPRIVLASSAHVMGQYARPGAPLIDPSWPVAPCCAYGATKAFGEALGRAHAYRTGASVVALRLGATTERPLASSALAAWLGTDDLRRLVARALDADVSYAVCPGISANTRSRWLTHNAIGYHPVQDSEAYAGDVPEDDSWGPCVGKAGPKDTTLPGALATGKG
ncbi:NAD-dependent epimerase/dehydratase family protein [Actinopolymorpha rutila]|uniref:Nucleoside-diphosphate-sugar epimerase n=1 Tax=Actinopolymorpha rutila TaxID=446787 RepID=A0A852Z8X3_9ACTN|nr:NAD(P)-dependent oxidoreductase [Actinopolymorpha rutila]NYH88302.1 nucleoside-diphosphate-sugar epimerase [Actinopolymorpha rutila]